MCFGNNNYGQLGDPSPYPSRLSYTAVLAPSDPPSPLSGLLGSIPADDPPTAIAALSLSTCVLGTSRLFRCLGRDVLRETSTVYPGSSALPVPSPASSSGSMGSGNLAIPRASLGEEVSGTRRVLRVVAGSDSICVLFFDGAVRCFGDARLGAIGSGSSLDAYGYNGRAGFIDDVAFAVGVTEMADVAMAADSACAITRGELAARCWGNAPGNPVYYGSTGRGDHSNEMETLTNIAFDDPAARIRKVALTETASAFVTFSGRVYVLGRKGPEIGTNATAGRDVGYISTGYALSSAQPPLQFSDAMPARDVSAAKKGFCALFSEDGIVYGGAVRCWGDNAASHGALGAPGAEFVGGGGDAGTPIGEVAYLDFGSTHRAVAVDGAAGTSCVLFEYAYGDLRARCFGSGLDYRNGRDDEASVGDREAGLPVSDARLLDFGGHGLHLWSLFPSAVCHNATANVTVHLFGPAAYLFEVDQVRVTDVDYPAASVVLPAEYLNMRTVTFVPPTEWELHGRDVAEATLEVYRGGAWDSVDGETLAFARIDAATLVLPAATTREGGAPIVLRAPQFAAIASRTGAVCGPAFAPSMFAPAFLADAAGDPELVSCGDTQDTSAYVNNTGSITFNAGEGFPPVSVSGTYAIYDPFLTGISVGFCPSTGGTAVTVRGAGLEDFGEAPTIIAEVAGIASATVHVPGATRPSPDEIAFTMPSFSHAEITSFPKTVYISAALAPSSSLTQKTTSVTIQLHAPTEALTILPSGALAGRADQEAFVSMLGLLDTGSVPSHVDARHHAVARFRLNGVEKDVNATFVSGRFESSVIIPSMGADVGDGDMNLSLDTGLTWSSTWLEVTWFNLTGAVSPVLGPIEGGTTVAIGGSWFPVDNSGFYCRFGGSGGPASRPLFMTRSLILCESPPSAGGAAIRVPLELSSDHGGSYFLAGHFDYFNATITAVAPPVAPSRAAEPGDAVTLLGSGFANVTGGDFSCKYGSGGEGIDFESAAVVTAGRELTPAEAASLGLAGPEEGFVCDLPGSAMIGMSAIRLSLNGQEFISATPGDEASAVTFFSVAKVNPGAGPVPGGTTVTLTGAGFSTGPGMRCIFSPAGDPGSAVSVPASATSPSSATCASPASPITAPPGADGVVHVEVAFNASLASENARNFSYYLAPVVSAVSPRSGRSGTEVTLFGANLMTRFAAPLCSFAGVPAALVSAVGVEPSVHFVCTAPALTDSAAIQFSLNGGADEHTTPEPFRYVTVFSVFPAAGTAAGGTALGISGSGFEDSPSGSGSASPPLCRFMSGGGGGGGPAVVVNATYKSIGYAECVAPPSVNGSLSAGVVEVSYSADGVLFSDTVATYTYYAQPNVTAMSPQFGPAGGSAASPITVTLYGSDLAAPPAAGPVLCRFGTMTANSTVVDASTMRCAVPPGVGVVPVHVTFNGGGDFSSRAESEATLFQYTSLASLVPTQGPASGGTSISISASGTSPLPAAKCTIDATVVAAASPRPSQAVCDSIPHPAGTVQVDYAPDGVVFTGVPLEYTYYETPTVTVLDPMRGPGAGGFPVTVWGSNFINTGLDLRCRFDATVTPALSVTAVGPSTYVVCTAPEMIGSVPVEVSLNGGHHYTGDATVFTYFAVFSVIPTTGPASGGSSVVLSGTGFDGAAAGLAKCEFGGVVVDAEVLSPAQAKCVVPPAASSSAVVAAEFSVDGVQFTEDGNLYSYFPTPVITSVDPPGAPRGLSTVVVTVRGIGFRTDPAAMRCKFGTIISENATILSPGALACPLPPGNGDVPLTVSFNSGFAYSSSTVRFTYISLFSVEPASGPSSGGTQVLFSGTGFVQTALSRCSFGDAGFAAADVLRLPQALCVSPPRAAGTVELALSADGTSFSQETGISFTYYDTPLATDVSPLRGPSAGGHIVTIRGDSFPRPSNYSGLISARCRFGVEIVEGNHTDENPDVVTCVSPPSAGEISVDVSFNAGFHFTASSLSIAYFSVFALVPSSGPSSGGTEVSVSGSRFSSAASAACRFEATAATAAAAAVPPAPVIVPATFASSSQVRCLAPALDPGEYIVEYTVDGESFTRDFRTYTSYKTPAAVSLSPRGSPADGGVTATVRGIDFFDPGLLSADGVRCRFAVFSRSGSIAPDPADPAAPPVVLCPVPAGGGRVTVSVSFNGGGMYTPEQLDFFYFHVNTLSPARGLVAGGTRVVLGGAGLVDELFSAPGSICTFGGDASGQIEYIDEFRMACRTPPNPNVGDVEVGIVVGGGALVVPSLLLSYAYYVQPTISEVSPVGGPSSGGTPIVMRGVGIFSSEEMSCRFGASTVVPAVVSSTKVGSVLRCESPVMSGTVPVAVSFNGVDFEDVLDFSYFSVSISRPQSAPVIGGTSIAILGSGFVDLPTITCTVGTLKGTARFESSDRVACVVPFVREDINPADPNLVGRPGDPIGVLPIRLAVDGVHFAESRDSFVRLYDPVRVTAFSPDRSVTSGGVAVTLLGDGFLTDAEDARCRFDVTSSQSSTLVAVNKSFAVCDSTAHAQGSVTLSVTMNGIDWHDAPSLFDYNQCPPGQFAKLHTDPCRPCPAGLFSNEPGARECTLCAANSFTETSGMTECTLCPDNSAIESVQRDSLLKCLCAPGYYHETLKAGSECKVCPPGGSCAGGEAAPVARPGFWSPQDAVRGETNDFIVLQCSTAASCPGGAARECKPGYEGRLCALCSDGYFKSGTECRVCPDSSYFSIIAFFLFILIVCVMLYRLVGTDAAAYGGTIGIVCYYCQTISILAKLDLKWPSSVQNSMAIMASPFSLDIDILASECSIPGMNYEKKWSGMMLLPWLFALLFLVVFTLGKIASLCCGGSGKKKKAAKGSNGQQVNNASLGDGLVNAYLLFLALGYLMLVTTSLQIFDCTENEDGNHSLDAQPNLLCYEDWWRRLVPPALFGACVYGVLVPTLFIYLLHRERKNLRDPIVIGRYGSIYVDYTPKRYYWESVVMAEKLLMAIVLTFFTRYTSAQLLAFLLVTVMGLAWHIVAQPFFVQRYNKLQTILRWCSCLVIVAGMLFNAGQFPDPFLRDLVTYGVFFILGLSIITVVGIVVYDIIVIRRSLSTKFSAAATLAIDKVVTPQGKTVLLEWLGSGVDPGIAPVFDGLIAEIGEFYLSGAFFSEVGMRPGEEVADIAVQYYTGDIFIAPAVPAVRRFVERNIELATKHGDVDALVKVRSFIRCFSERLRFDFFTDLGVKGAHIGSTPETFIPWIDKIEDAAGVSRGRLMVPAADDED